MFNETLVMAANSESGPYVYNTDTTDKYTASLELSNACRNFYLNRVKTTQKLKKKVLENKNSNISPMESALHTLRQEMASLMEQDVSLMKQLLILNENIEEMKCNRLCNMGLSTDSMCTSSDGDLVFPHVNDKGIMKRFRSGILLHSQSVQSKSVNESRTLPTLVTEHHLKPSTCYLQCGQNSIDSGYDDSEHYHSDSESNI